MSISVQPYLSLGVFGNFDLVEMGLFYTTDETIKRALGVYGDRNESTTYVDEFLEETTEVDNVIELEESVQELTIEMAVERLMAGEELPVEVSVKELATEVASMAGDTINELTLESLLAELGLYLPVIEVRPIRFIIFTAIFTLRFTVYRFTLVFRF